MEQRAVNASDGTISVAAAAGQLGVSRTAIWWMIADGDIDAERRERGGRLQTRVRLPEADPARPEEPAKSRTARLQEQVDELSHTVARLSDLLVAEQAKRAHAERAFSMLTPGVRAPALLRSSAPPRDLPPAPERHGSRKTAGDPAASRLNFAVRWVQGSNRAVNGVCQVGITSRPNPMTHPLGATPEPHADNREELFAPIQNLLKSRQREWWQRLPLVTRN